MANVTVEFTAKRRLKTGVSAGSVVNFSFEVTDFDITSENGTATFMAKSGRKTSRFYYEAMNYSMTTKPGSVTDNEEFVMFLQSTANGEPFTMTNPVEGNRPMSVKREGAWSPQRVSSSMLNLYIYELKVRELF